VAAVTGWLRIEADWFCCGLHVTDDMVDQAAPVVHFMLVPPRRINWVRWYCDHRKWRLTRLVVDLVGVREEEL